MTNDPCVFLDVFLNISAVTRDDMSRAQPYPAISSHAESGWKKLQKVARQGQSNDGFFWRWWGWVQSNWIQLGMGQKFWAVFSWSNHKLSEAAFPNLSQLPVEGGLKLSYACESPTPHGESRAKAARKTSQKTSLRKLCVIEKCQHIIFFFVFPPNTSKYCWLLRLSSLREW